VRKGEPSLPGLRSRFSVREHTCPPVPTITWEGTGGDTARIAEIVPPDAISHGPTLPAGEVPNNIDRGEVCELVHTPAENFTGAWWVGSLRRG
jgi:hypothetical protein